MWNNVGIPRNPGVDVARRKADGFAPEKYRRSSEHREAVSERL